MSKKIERTINFYELEFKFNKDFNPTNNNKHAEMFVILIQLAKSRAKIRYQQFGERAIFIQGVKVDKNNNLIDGKLRCIRKDLLPELMNTDTDESRGIEAKEAEGLLETTHFVIDYSKENSPLLSIEYNQFGAKIGDLVLYLKNIGISKDALEEIGYLPIVKDELSKLQSRIKRCSEFKVKVHKDNVKEIEKMDNRLYSALKSSTDHFKSDYATLILKFDYRQREFTDSMNNSLNNIIRNIISDKKKTELFNILSVKAEDRDNNNLLQTFDLLIDKVKSKIKVEKKKRYRTVVSEDILEKMKIEMSKIKLR